MFNVPAFIISFSIGILFVYLSGPKRQIIYVLPTPDNEGQIQYKDLAGTCFSFKTRESKCSLETGLIKKYTVQHQKESS